ncbi:hypothetical protein SLEP1_g46603 [Rubroshorea leprosula]|uniref:Phase-change related protein n=1 Tax=Rubroshorea leprosula TaxID=152421 RepID=A0AAV5LMU4_9ROSI|nr:hypothetical protein SLEP1_g46603 [Rubroshorea leprosula]
MASSKVLLLLGLAFAVVLLISSEVSARELAEATEATETAKIGEATTDAHHVEHHKHEKKHHHHHKKHHKPGQAGTVEAEAETDN